MRRTNCWTRTDDAAARPDADRQCGLGAIIAGDSGQAAHGKLRGYPNMKRVQWIPEDSARNAGPARRLTGYEISVTNVNGTFKSAHRQRLLSFGMSL